MPNLRFVPAIVVLCLFVALVAVGAVWWVSWAGGQADAGAVRQCLAQLDGRDPVADARADVARGEDRFYFTAPDDGGGGKLADGVVVTPGSGAQRVCRDGGRYADSRPFPFEPAPPGTDGQACADALDRYVRDYNGQMARSSPASIGKYCRLEDRVR